jgi:hypothetical protein
MEKPVAREDSVSPLTLDGVMAPIVVYAAICATVRRTVLLDWTAGICSVPLMETAKGRLVMVVFAILDARLRYLRVVVG